MIIVISVIAMVFSILGNILVNHKKKSGFVIWTLSNILWVIVNVIGEINIPQCIMFVLYGILNVVGWIRWSKEDKYY